MTFRQTMPRCAIARFGGIGDNLVASSIIPLLAQDYIVDVITNDPHHVIFENNPWVDRIIKVRREDMPPDGLPWQTWFVQRSHEYDRFIHLSHSMELSLVLVPAQTPFWWTDKPRRMLCGHSYLERAHDIAEVPHVFDPGPRFYPTTLEWDAALYTKSTMGARVIGWCLSGSRIDKILPHTAMVIARLLRETGLAVCMFGSPGRDFEMAKQILEQVTLMNGHHRGLHLALSSDADKPNWPIRRALAQVQTCDVVIGPDTGLMWAVAMEAMPKIVLLSHASPTNITQHWHHTVSLHADAKQIKCWPCHRLHDDLSTCTPNETNTGAACISSITTGMIVHAVVAALERPAAKTDAGAAPEIKPELQTGD